MFGGKYTLGKTFGVKYMIACDSPFGKRKGVGLIGQFKSIFES